MKKIFFVLFLLSFVKVNAQHSCCSKPGSSALAFADLSKDPDFVSSHLAPLPLDYEPKIGKMVSLKTADGIEARAFEVRGGQSNGKVILMFHEWWGLNDYIKREAERVFSETGYTVLALDLYDGKVASTPDSAAAYMQGLKEGRARDIILAGIDYAGQQGKIQTIGWCMGGTWSLQAAMMAGDHCTGCVMYYGMPEKDMEKINKFNAPILGFFGNQDKWISPAVVNEFHATMKKAGKKFTFQEFDADHAFANPSNPKYNKPAAEEAHGKAIVFLKNNFQQALTPPTQKH
jgi:carboxymethylenebutenolidase